MSDKYCGCAEDEFCPDCSFEYSVELAEKNRQIKSKCDRYEQALKFYANPESWQQLDENKCYKKRGKGIFYIDDRSSIYLATDNGEIARESLNHKVSEGK